MLRHCCVSTLFLADLSLCVCVCVSLLGVVMYGDVGVYVRERTEGSLNSGLTFNRLDN